LLDDRPLIDALSSAALARINELTSQNLSNIAWALATLGVRNEPLLDAIASAALARSTELSPQDLSNIAWAYAKLDYQTENLLQAISAAAIRLMGSFGGQDLGITSWACAKLELRHLPLLSALSAEAIRKISECAPQNLSNLAWAWATMGIPNEPLLNAISSASLATIADFNTQNLANTAWSFARLICRNNPLMEAISSAVLTQIKGFVSVDAPQESYAIIWSFWRTFDPTEVGTALGNCLASGVMSDALVHGMLLSIGEWRMAAPEERRLQFALGRGLPPCALRTLWLQGEGNTLPAPMVFESLYHMYQKLSKCVDYVAAGTRPFLGAAHVLKRIESYGQDLGQWLKIAGGDKARVTEDALERRGAEEHEISAEFGAFVGYSGIRFARCILSSAAPVAARSGISSLSHHRGLAGCSLEVDPIHVSVARHFIDLAGLSSWAEVWLGLLQDTLAVIPERAGERAMAFSFMDQRGTTFHTDLAHIEKMRLLPIYAAATADNVNKPGAPILLWHLTRTSSFDTVLWSMGEFASEYIEDWQSVAFSKPP